MERTIFMMVRYMLLYSKSLQDSIIDCDILFINRNLRIPVSTESGSKKILYRLNKIERFNSLNNYLKDDGFPYYDFSLTNRFVSRSICIPEFLITNPEKLPIIKQNLDLIFTFSIPLIECVGPDQFELDISLLIRMYSLHVRMSRLGQSLPLWTAPV